MSILQNLGDTLSATLNNAIEQKAKPDKMARYYAEKAEQELDISRNRAMAIMADKEALERDAKQTREDIEEMAAYAEAAMKKGNKDDTRRFLELKRDLSDKLRDLEKAIAEATKSEQATLEAYDLHCKEVAAMQSEMHEISANVATAESITASNNYPSSMSNRATSLFKKMRDKSRRMVDEANAGKRLTEQATPVAIENLKKRYNAPADTVAEELAALEKKFS